MKKLLISILLSIFISNMAYADCNWATDIKALADGGYEYSKGCHLKVGQLVQDNQTQAAQLLDYQKAISLKDLAIKASDDRATLWNNTASSLETRLQKVDTLEKHNEWLYFGLGALTVIGAGFMTAKLVK